MCEWQRSIDINYFHFLVVHPWITKRKRVFPFQLKIALGSIFWQFFNSPRDLSPQSFCFPFHPPSKVILRREGNWSDEAEGYVSMLITTCQNLEKPDANTLDEGSGGLLNVHTFIYLKLHKCPPPSSHPENNTSTFLSSLSPLSWISITNLLFKGSSRLTLIEIYSFPSWSQKELMKLHLEYSLLGET